MQVPLYPHSLPHTSFERPSDGCVLFPNGGDLPAHGGPVYAVTIFDEHFSFMLMPVVLAHDASYEFLV
jgi:hypothetical protein